MIYIRMLGDPLPLALSPPHTWEDVLTYPHAVHDVLDIDMFLHRASLTIKLVIDKLINYS